MNEVIVKDLHRGGLIPRASLPFRVSGLAIALSMTLSMTMSLSFALVLGMCAMPTPVHAQAASPHGDTATSTAPATVPTLPPGDGRMTVEVVFKDSGEPAPGIDVALYALAPDGTPGLGSGTTDSAGRHVFDGISTASDITYLAGANFEDVPFGERVAFEPGQSSQLVRVEVIRASTEGPPIGVEETRVQVGWLGQHLLFEVTHLLRNPGDRVRRIQDTARADHPPLFEAALPAEFVEFAEAAVGFADGLERDGTKIRFWGPVYPGQQQVRYRFTIAVPDGAAGTNVEVALPQTRGSGHLTVLTPASGPHLVGDAGSTPSKRLDLEGVAYDAVDLAAIEPGGHLALVLAVPPSRSDASAIAIPRADVWLDHDDAVVSVRAQIQLEVAAGPHVQGSTAVPLMHIDLPPNAVMQGASAATQNLGFGEAEGGGLDLVGPVPPGQSSIEFAYDLPTEADGSVDFEFRIDHPMSVVNVLVADNGIALESSRLHRRRPFRQGTRNYLHRRAFQVDAREAVDLQLSPLDEQAAPRNRSMLAMLVLGAGAAWLLVSPLRVREGEVADAEEPAQWQREMLYEAIRDLDDDLDTGKVDAKDHAELRAQLRSEAIELVRRERNAAADGDPAAATAPHLDGDQAQQAAAEAADAPAKADASPGNEGAAFCPSCGGRTRQEWKFCSHCGGGLAST